MSGTFSRFLGAIDALEIEKQVTPEDDAADTAEKKYPEKNQYGAAPSRKRNNQKESAPSIKRKNQEASSFKRK